MNIGAGLIPIGFSLFSVMDTEQPRTRQPVELNERQYEFRVVEKEPVNHTFYFTNWTGDTLQVAGVKVSEPIASVFVTPKVRAGKVGRVDFSVADPRPAGNYDGKIEIRFKDESVSNLVYKVSGTFVSAMEVSPLPAFFVTAESGKTKSTNLDIFNRATKPVKILKAESSSERFDLKLSTVEEGKHYRLELTMRTHAAPGRATESITVTTSDPQRPTFTIPANTVVREAVYASPERIDFGQIDLKDVRVNERLAEQLSQAMTIFQTGGTNLIVSAETEIPFLKLSLEPGQTGDRCRLHVDVDPKKFSEGQFNGAILLKTNDRETSQLKIPVTAMFANSEEF